MILNMAVLEVFRKVQKCTNCNQRENLTVLVMTSSLVHVSHCLRFSPKKNIILYFIILSYQLPYTVYIELFFTYKLYTYIQGICRLSGKQTSIGYRHMNIRLFTKYPHGYPAFYRISGKRTIYPVGKPVFASAKKADPAHP